jgi:signal transduction histidine kinase
MERLLNELLQFVRIGNLLNSPIAVPLQEIVGEVLELVAGQIAGRGVQVESTREPVWLCGDRQRLVQLFQNLVDNAVKFMGDQPDPRIEIGAETEGGEIVLFVRDNGKGIDPRHRSKLFGLFERLDPNMPGSGMGLATVLSIVKMHGGKIHAESEGLGKGTTFRFTLAKTELRRPE